MSNYTQGSLRPYGAICADAVHPIKYAYGFVFTFVLLYLGYHFVVDSCALQLVMYYVDNMLDLKTHPTWIRDVYLYSTERKPY